MERATVLMEGGEQEREERREGLEAGREAPVGRRQERAGARAGLSCSRRARWQEQGGRREAGREREERPGRRSRPWGRPVSPEPSSRREARAGREPSRAEHSPRSRGVSARERAVRRPSWRRGGTREVSALLPARLTVSRAGKGSRSVQTSRSSRLPLRSRWRSGRPSSLQPRREPREE
jgi:hypothetical protein